MALVIVLSLGFPVQALGNDSADTHIVRDNASENKIMGEHIPGQMIIKLIEGVSLDDITDKYQLKSAKKVLKADSKKNKKADKAIKLHGLDRLYVVEISSEKDLMNILEKLNNDPRVEYAEPDYVVSMDAFPNDPDLSLLYGFHNTGQTGGIINADINAPEAWDIQKGSEKVIIAVIDTGVDYNHPDLAKNMWINLGEIPGDGLDNDGNGYVDDVYGYDFYNNDGDPMDDHNHGSHCAGTIGGVGNNGKGVVGVNWNVSIMSVKFLSKYGSGSTTGAIASIGYAMDNGADIMSNSWGSTYYSLSLKNAIIAADDAGILFVAAAGNSGSNNDVNPHYPSSYDVSNVVAVAATDHNDNKAYFSCYGPNSVDLGAPGVSIYSTFKNGGYGYYSGTSMATPHVAGVAGLIKAQYPDFGSDEIKARLMSGVDVIPSMDGITVSGGRLNAWNSLDNDNTSPSSITNLAITDAGYNFVSLTWISVGDDGLSGKASSYDIRYSTSEITDISWDDALQAVGEPIPETSGSVENFTVQNLEFGTTYHFAIKATDNVGNVAGLSNIVSESTTAPAIAYSTDMENASEFDVDGLWHHETYRSNSPVSSFAYNTGGPYYTYNTGASNSGSLTSPVIDLSNFTSTTLAFKYFYKTESTGIYWDQRWVQVGVDGVFADVIQLSGDSMFEWNECVIDMSSYDGENVQIRFFFDTADGYINDYEGWYIDDILIFGEKENVPPIANAGPDQISFVGKPVVFNGSESFDPDGNVASLEWDFGDGTSASGVVVSHSYSVDGNYTVTLSVIDNGGAIATDTASVEAVATDIVTVTKAQYANYKNENKERTLYLQATSSCGGEAVLEAYRVSDNFYYGEMVYNIDRNLFILTVYDNITVNPEEITVTSLLGGYDTKEVTNKFKNN